MARRPADSPVSISVFDRLIDDEPKTRTEAPPTRVQSMRELKAALRRDLEWLLNTRQPLYPPPDGSEELPRSLYNYGLPDITSMSVSSIEDRESWREGWRQRLLFSSHGSRILKYNLCLPARERPTCCGFSSRACFA